MADLDSTAERVALWRALHVLADAPPHIMDDGLALTLVAPPNDWRARPDMDPSWTGPFRAGIVARGRFVEDLVEERAGDGLAQYVILGAGLDTFAQRRSSTASRLDVYEVDQTETQAWKRDRLADLGIPEPEWLHFVPVDFEQGATWWDALPTAGFDTNRPAVVASSGVSMYLTRAATFASMRHAAMLAPGSTMAMTFLLPTELLDEADRPAFEAAQAGARRSGTPFISLYTPEEVIAAAEAAGFRHAEHVSSGQIADRYFAGRPDDLRPSTGEDFLVATT